MLRFVLALALAVMAPVPAAAEAANAPAPDDRYLWLEDVTGERALEWARARNEESARFSRRDFAALEKRFVAILDSDARIPYVVKLGPLITTSGRTRKSARPWRHDARRVPEGTAGLGDRPRSRCAE
jgi:hypothetical protein